MTQINKLLRTLAIVICIILGNSCKDDDPSTSNEPVGPVSAERFNNVPPPSYEDVQKAFDEVVTNDAEIAKKDQDELSLALFGVIEKKYEKNSGEYLKSTERLSTEEWALYIRESLTAYKVRYAAVSAYSGAVSRFTCEQNVMVGETKASALRDAYWSVLLVRESSLEFAEKVVKAHLSIFKSQQTKDICLHNHKIGQELAQRYTTAKTTELLQVLVEEQYVYLQSQAISTDITGLVYTTGKKQYDVTLTGTFTNPDSGGPWDATFTMHQCGSEIRGHYIVKRGKDMQKRRYSGTIDQNNRLVLDIAYPYEFENTTGIIPCRNMKATLTGTENELNGSWTSTNCSKGGDITLKK